VTRVIWTRGAVEDVEAVKALESFPESGRVVPDVGDESLREIINGAYRIVYRIEFESVRIMRELQELSQNELAKLTGIPQSTLSAIENDRVNLGVERAKVLARASARVAPSQPAAEPLVGPQPRRRNDQFKGDWHDQPDFPHPSGR
jgi:DNA-binding XRE family transcriptional regulator